MPKPFAICLEDIKAASEGERYLRCTALVGRKPGLRITNSGDVLWEKQDDIACEIWVSADDRLILYRSESGGKVTLRRAERSLDVPAEKPVVMIDKDQLDVGGRSLRIHVHGVAKRVKSPSYLPVKPFKNTSKTAKMAAAVALSAVVSASGCSSTIDVRNHPPDETEIEEPINDPQAEGMGQDQMVEGTQAPEPQGAPIEPTPPIDIREEPPEMVEE